MMEEEIASLAKEDKQETMKLDGFSNNEEQIRGKRGKCKKLGPLCTRGRP